MALRAIKGLIKFENLMRDLGLTYYQAIGILEALWHFTATNAIQGDIGRHPNQDIATWIGYTGNADVLIEALVARRWLERHSKHRLIVHDWHIHADKSVRATLKNRGMCFCMTEDLTKTPEKIIGNQNLESGSLSGSGAEYGSGSVYGSGAGAESPPRPDSPFETPPRQAVYVNPIARYAEPVQSAAREAHTIWYHFAHGNLPNLHSESTAKDLKKLAAAEEAQPGTLIERMQGFVARPPPGFPRDSPLFKVLNHLGYDAPLKNGWEQQKNKNKAEANDKLMRAIRGEKV